MTDKISYSEIPNNCRSNQEENNCSEIPNSSKGRKLHYTIHGHTAAELIQRRADGNKKNMVLTSWKNSPSGKILKSDVSVAKNYLSKEEGVRDE